MGPVCSTATRSVTIISALSAERSHTGSYLEQRKSRRYSYSLSAALASALELLEAQDARQTGSVSRGLALSLRFDFSFMSVVDPSVACCQQLRPEAEGKNPQ